MSNKASYNFIDYFIGKVYERKLAEKKQIISWDSTTGRWVSITTTLQSIFRSRASINHGTNTNSKQGLLSTCVLLLWCYKKVSVRLSRFRATHSRLQMTKKPGLESNLLTEFQYGSGHGLRTSARRTSLVGEDKLCINWWRQFSEKFNVDIITYVPKHVRNCTITILTKIKVSQDVMWTLVVAAIILIL